MITKRKYWAACALIATSVGLATAVPAVQASPKSEMVTRPTLGKVRYKYTLSKIAWTGSRDAIAASDRHGDLYYFWRRNGSSTWHKELVAKGGRRSGYSQPSIAWIRIGHTVFIAAIDSSGDLVSFNQRAGRSKWTHQRIAKAGARKYQAPSVTVGANGTVLVSAGRTSGQLDSFQRAPGRSTWVRRIVGHGSFGASSITSVYDSLVSRDLALITATSGGNLYFWWEVVDTPGWTKETIANAGPGVSYTGATVTTSANDVLVTAATTSVIDFWYQPIGGSGWTQETVANGAPWYAHPQVFFASPPDSPPFDFITAVTDTGTLVFWWKFDGMSENWQPETIAAAGAKAAYARPAIAISNKATIITAINSKPGDVLFWYQGFGETGWHKQLVAKG